ncbi:hypothetical protein HELRODRAFT_177868 [Helobdella robusta]|uniref:Uncharacterized protein n=1 Tax=Helobdella robusta TaxID=6412 RepID=T1FCE2_HELRO|nr:hypothetical protein HELRODRAFT_177868 [Helobdella robusta]ESN97803.1 hypothetical protein HELRODRAFT_177868 [Helobdella robusta]
MAGKGRSTKNSNSDALRCEKESTDVQCVCCGISFAVGMTEESLELLKACDNVKFVCDECLKSPSIKDQIIKTVESGKAEICDKINSLSKEIRSEIDAIKVLHTNLLIEHFTFHPSAFDIKCMFNFDYLQD